MRSVQLKFKKLGEHWYPDIPHNNPADLKLDPKIERLIGMQDTWKDGLVTNIAIVEQPSFIIPEGLIQFDDQDIDRFFTTDDEFDMNLYISGHKFTISSKLYFLLEQAYKFDFHEQVYRINVF